MSLPSDLKDAINNVRTYSNLQRSIIAVADAVDDIARLETAAAEAEARARTARAGADDAERDVDKAKAAKLKAEQACRDAEDRAKEIIAKGKADADRLVIAARNEAEAIKAAAHAVAQDISAKARKAADDKAGALADLDGRIAAAQQHLDQLRADAAEAEKREAKARSFIASLKE